MFIGDKLLGIEMECHTYVKRSYGIRVSYNLLHENHEFIKLL